MPEAFPAAPATAAAWLLALSETEAMDWAASCIRSELDETFSTTLSSLSTSSLASVSRPPRRSSSAWRAWASCSARGRSFSMACSLKTWTALAMLPISSLLPLAGMAMPWSPAARRVIASVIPVRGPVMPRAMTTAKARPRRIAPIDPVSVTSTVALMASCVAPSSSPWMVVRPPSTSLVNSPASWPRALRVSSSNAASASATCSKVPA